ncbi:hypothetical protein KVR01_011738 [Diaporthe batatas]|uniref:uncharacterized protein n=1 Tax=Diaporthe batatas TaxID=748121 RepID=UPI001D059821|nr:uncharacterized protein KVR01_011738 [Diaporthe batatas]KAG8158616.1 hypothetical protein KVR01_011738 [Diaporthe batatas]
MAAQTAEQQKVSDDGHFQANDGSKWPSYSPDGASVKEHGGMQAARDKDHSVLNDGASSEENDPAESSVSAEKSVDSEDSDAKLVRKQGYSCDELSEDDLVDSESGIRSLIRSDLSDFEEDLRGRPLREVWNKMARSVKFLAERPWSVSPSRMRSRGMKSLTGDRERVAFRDHISRRERLRRNSYSWIERRKMPLNTEGDGTNTESNSEDDSSESLSGVDDVEPEEQLCETCRGINAEVLASGYEHLHLDELQKSAKFCRLCRWLERGIYVWSMIPSASFSGLFSIVLSCESLVVRYPQTSWSERHDFPYFTNEDDPAVQYGVRSRSRLTTTKSEKSFETARTWLRECLECKGPHTMVKERPDTDNVSRSSEPSRTPYESSSSGGSLQDEISPHGGIEQIAAERPSRLIDLHPESTGPGVLKLVLSLSGSHEYMTLSYCWGEHRNPSWITTKENVRRRLESFSTSELPATLSDAVNIADRLGARYLWIDAICIVQDDVDEWELEGGRMAGIYRGAVLCIAASSSVSSVDGIYNTRSTSHFERSRDKIIRIDGTVTTRGTDRSSERVKSTLYFQDRDMQELFKADRIINSYINRGPLSERAWALQERLLSSRVLYYTRDQLVWQCDHCQSLEDRILHNRAYSPDFHYKELRALSSKKFDGDQVGWLWYRAIVSGYSDRKLTYGSDKLIAISALARAVCLDHPDVYLAGLWRESLIDGLMWCRVGPGCKSGEYRAPSWSWASQDSKVMFSYSNERGDCDCVVTAFDVQTDESNTMGKVSGGFIKLRARAMGGIVMRTVEDKDEYQYRLVLWDDKSLISCVAYMDDDDDIKVKTVVCIYISGISGLLLRPVASEEGAYERLALENNNYEIRI